MHLKRTVWARGRRYLGALALLSVSWAVFAQTQAQYRFDHWGTDAGLPQSAANAVCQTRDGYIWVATFDGLARFNGVGFAVFNKANTPGIPHNRFARLYEDNNGTVWAVTEDNQLVKYQAGLWTAYTVREESWLAARIIGLGADANGNFQAFTRENVATWQKGRFHVSAVADLMPTPPTARWIMGNVLAKVDAAHLYVYAQGRFTTYTTQSGLPTCEIRGVFQDQYGVLWFNTQGQGLVRLQDGRFTAFPDINIIDAAPFDLEDTLVLYGVSVLQDQHGNIWFTGSDKRLGRWNQGHLEHYPNIEGTTYSVTAFYEDREGNFWLGNGYGLYRARERGMVTYTKRDAPTLDNLYTIYEDRAGSVWFGGWGNSAGDLTQYRNGVYRSYGRADGLLSDLITALYEDPAGALLVGTTTGLYRLQEGRLSAYPNQAGRFKACPGAKDFTFNKDTWAIHQDQARRTWFGTKEGLIKYEAGCYTRYTTKDGLADDDVKAIVEDRNGVLWFGTWGGLSRFQDGGFTSYTEERDGLPGNHIRTLHADAQDVLWIGTYDSGLGRFKDDTFTRYTEREGLFNNGVFRILEDGRGYFWMSCNRGIYRVRRQELEDYAAGRRSSITSVAYGKADGLPADLECNGGRQPAGWQTHDGRLWFPCFQGAVVIDPARLESNPLPPPLVIEEARLNREVAGISNATLEIPPEKNNNLEISYQGLSFIRPEQMRFKYRLDGIDENWIEVGNRRVAYYNELPPGDYTFRMLAANSDGVWSREEAQLRVIVHPAWWQTWWFFVRVVLVALGSAGWLGYRRWVHFRRERELRDEAARLVLEGQERERKRIAGDMHADLGQLVSLIKHHASSGLDKIEESDPLVRHLGEIYSSTVEARKKMHEIAYALRPPELEQLGLTRALEALLAQAPGLDVTSDIAPLDNAWNSNGEISIYRIVQETLNNIVQHAQADKVRCSVKREGQALRIAISDNGRGFVPSTQNGAGLGLAVIKERTRLLGGTVDIDSAPKQGTRLAIVIPLPKPCA